jgi:16S rRNA (guanine966-N2)-methyltransferase
MKGRKVTRKGVGGDSKHGTLRPTSSKVRESIFNIIGPDIRDAVFVDLYAGSGAVGMEAMSRGAINVLFIEADRQRANTLRDTLEGCGCQAKARIMHMEAEDFLREHKANCVWDVVFLDPPYHSEQYEIILPLISQSSGVVADTLVMAEHASKISLPGRVGRLVIKKTYKYGDTSLTVYGVE